MSSMASTSFITFVLIFGTYCLRLGVLVDSVDVSGLKIWREDEGEDRSEGPKFNYLEVDEWGGIDPSYAKCSDGDSQSPVDINTDEAVEDNSLEPLERDSRVKAALLSSHGCIVEIVFRSCRGGLTVHGKTYRLSQFHIHTPSEHFLNGVQYAAELHQVHTAEDGSRAVVGVLFKHGRPSPFIDVMMPQLQELAKKPCPSSHQTSSPITGFNSTFLRKWPRNYYRYHGSLTTPPCDENVIWSVLTEVKTISREQIEALKAPLCDANKNNARPTQPLNHRKVFKYDLD